MARGAGCEQANATATRTTTHVASETELFGRTARCSCGAERSSDYALAFFEYRGENSRAATVSCLHCGYYEEAHDGRPHTHICEHFEPHGAYDTDIFYCGCRGWN